MKNELFKTEEDIKEAVANFRALKQTAGWQLLFQIVEANIKILEQQILDGFEDETKEQIDRKRDKLRAYKEVIETPDYWINRLTTNPVAPEVEDPYHTVDSLKEERFRRSQE